MHRKDILSLFETYKSRGLSAEDASLLARVEEFIKAEPKCFDRDLSHGHLTGSALVVNPALDRVLLTHHKKLGKWLQLGGHADGNALIDEVALQEVREESGLSTLHFWHHKKVPFDVDIHEIPERPGEPKHLHYDVRFLVVANDRAPLEVSDESHDVKWFSIDEARALCPERSMQRQFEKCAALGKTPPSPLVSGSVAL